MKKFIATVVTTAVTIFSLSGSANDKLAETMSGMGKLVADLTKNIPNAEIPKEALAKSAAELVGLARLSKDHLPDQVAALGESPEKQAQVKKYKAMLEEVVVLAEKLEIQLSKPETPDQRAKALEIIKAVKALKAPGHAAFKKD